MRLLLLGRLLSLRLAGRDHRALYGLDEIASREALAWRHRRACGLICGPLEQASRAGQLSLVSLDERVCCLVGAPTLPAAGPSGLRARLLRSHLWLGLGRGLLGLALYVHVLVLIRGRSQQRGRQHSLLAGLSHGRSAPGAAVEERLDVLPGVLDVLALLLALVEIYVLAPRVDVGRVGRVAVGGVRLPMRVEDELVWRVELAAVEALDALGARRDVPGRYEAPLAAIVDPVRDGEEKVLRKLGRLLLDEKRAAQSLGLAHGDHAAAARRARHRTCPAQHLQLDRRALDAGDAQGDAPVVDLVVAELLEEGVGDLRQAEALLAVDDQRHDAHPEQIYLFYFVLALVGQSWALRGSMLEVVVSLLPAGRLILLVRLRQIGRGQMLNHAELVVRQLSRLADAVLLVGGNALVSRLVLAVFWLLLPGCMPAR